MNDRDIHPDPVDPDGGPAGTPAGDRWSLPYCAGCRDRDGELAAAERERQAAWREVERLRGVIESRHGGEPLALLSELDEAREEIERLRGEWTKAERREQQAMRSRCSHPPDPAVEQVKAYLDAAVSEAKKQAADRAVAWYRLGGCDEDCHPDHGCDRCEDGERQLRRAIEEGP